MTQTVIKCGSGISFLEALQLIFIVLKLCGVINWSWLVVLLPTLIPIGLALSAITIAVLCFILCGIGTGIFLMFKK